MSSLLVRSPCVGPEADVYALGAILYELLTGRPPFLGASLAEVLDRIRSQAPPPPARLRPDVPRPLETISLKCLEKEPAQRYAGAGALAADLRRYLDGAAVLGRRSGLGTRFGAWSRRPERIGEAAILAVLNGIVGVLCTIVPAVGAITGRLPVPDPAAAAWQLLLILLYYPTLHFTLAGYTFARRGWAIRAGAILTPLIVLWATGIIFGWIDTGDYYSGSDPAMRLMLELAAGSMLVLQAVLYGFALRAWNPAACVGGGMKRHRVPRCRAWYLVRP